MMGYSVAILLEVLFVNLYQTHLLSKKKYSTLFSLITLLIFTSILIVILYIYSHISEVATIKSVYIGTLFIIPIFFLYDMKIQKIVTIMIYCWSYTISINTISFGLASILNASLVNLYTFIIQTVLISISALFMFKFSKKNFREVLDKSNKRTQYRLLVLGASIFIAFVGIRYYLDPTSSIYFFLTITLIMISIMSYLLIVTIVQSNASLKTTRRIAYKDSLTGVRNRHSLFINFETVIQNISKFSILFLDLDDLKSINDKYSHIIGDQYIIEFSRILTYLTKENGQVYRFAGDEFIVILEKPFSKEEVEELEKTIVDEMNKTYEFNGVSIGTAFYPENGESVDELINYADEKMYGEKRRKKVRRL